MKTVHLRDDPRDKPDGDYSILVTNYEEGSYEGSGVAYALRTDNVVCEFYLGHCSCYGPFDAGWSGERTTPSQTWPYSDFERLVTGDEVTVGTVADLTAAKRLVEEVRRD